MNKEELKDTLWNGFKSWETYGGVETEMVYVPKQALFDLIDQLDEADGFDRVLLKHIKGIYNQYEYDYLPGFINDMKDGLTKINEPEKVVVPEFVEKRINYCPFCGERIIHHGE